MLAAAIGGVVFGLAALACMTAMQIRHDRLVRELTEQSALERHSLWDRIQRPERVPSPPVYRPDVPDGVPQRPEGAWSPGDDIPETAQDVIKMALIQSGGDLSGLTDEEFKAGFRTDGD